MSNFCCLLDACTIINLIHIDEDEFLFKKLEKVDYALNSVVFDEVKKNVFLALEKESLQKYSNKEEIKKKRKDIDHILPIFQGKQKNNKEIFEDIGISNITKIKQITNHSKKDNGELCSAIHALYLSRIESKKVLFYTDDYPAKEQFKFFFDYQQIGQIKDSVDFLILLYLLDEQFTEHQLDKFLSELFSQYAIEIRELTKELENFESGISVKDRRNKKLDIDKLRELILTLKSFKLEGVGQIYLYFEGRKESKSIYDILKKYTSILELERKSTEETLFKKIVEIRNAIKNNQIFKWDNFGL